MKWHPIKSDQRWTITKEHTGHEKPQFVIRFCDDWVDSRSTYSAAIMRAVGAKNERDGAPIIEDKDHE